MTFKSCLLAAALAAALPGAATAQTANAAADKASWEELTKFLAAVLK